MFDGPRDDDTHAELWEVDDEELDLCEALVVLDDNQRFIPLGLWGLPRALHAVWSGELQ